MGDTSEVLVLIIVFLQNYTAPQCLAGLNFKKYTTMRFFAYCYESRHHSCETFEALAQASKYRSSSKLGFLAGQGFIYCGMLNSSIEGARPL